MLDTPSPRHRTTDNIASVTHGDISEKGSTLAVTKAYPVDGGQRNSLQFGDIEHERDDVEIGQIVFRKLFWL